MFNPSNPTQIAQLKTELTSDPSALGYAASVQSGQDVVSADELNWIRDGVTACPDNSVVGTAITVYRNDVMPWEIAQAIDYRDIPAAPAGTANVAAALAWLQGLFALRVVSMSNSDGSDTTVLKGLKVLLPATSPQGGASVSRAAIIALASRNGSRAEQLWGTGTVIDELWVAKALRG